MLKECKYVFSSDYKDVKGPVKGMGETEIDLIPRTKPVKNIPYKLAHKYKEIVHEETNSIVEDDIIYPIDKSEWTSPMVMKPEERDLNKLRIYIDFINLHIENLIDPFTTPFSNQIINEVAWHKRCSSTNGFFGYNQVQIDKEYYEKIDFGSFTYRVISLRLKHAQVVFSRIIVKTFKENNYKMVVVYFENWTNNSVFKNHV